MRWLDLKEGDVVWSVGMARPDCSPFVVLSVRWHLPGEDAGAADVEGLYLDDLRRHTFRGMRTMWRSADVLRGQAFKQEGDGAR